MLESPELLTDPDAFKSGCLVHAGNGRTSTSPRALQASTNDGVMRHPSLRKFFISTAPHPLHMQKAHIPSSTSAPPLQRILAESTIPVLFPNHIQYRFVNYQTKLSTSKRTLPYRNDLRQVKLQTHYKSQNYFSFKKNLIEHHLKFFGSPTPRCIIILF